MGKTGSPPAPGTNPEFAQARSAVPLEQSIFPFAFALSPGGLDWTETGARIQTDGDAYSGMPIHSSSAQVRAGAARFPKQRKPSLLGLTCAPLRWRVH